MPERVCECGAMSASYSILRRLDESMATCAKCDERAAWLHEWATGRMPCSAFYYYCEEHKPHE